MPNKFTQSVRACVNHLAANSDLLLVRGQTEAAEVAIAVAQLGHVVLHSESISGSDHQKTLLALSEMLALSHGNGVGEAIVWPAYRRAGMHSVCEEWTSLTNELRSARIACLAEHLPAHSPC